MRNLAHSLDPAGCEEMIEMWGFPGDLTNPANHARLRVAGGASWGARLTAGTAR
jgi:hypothetical protein